MRHHNNFEADLRPETADFLGALYQVMHKQLYKHFIHMYWINYFIQCRVQ